jgi:hypothetical protein
MPPARKEATMSDKQQEIIDKALEIAMNIGFPSLEKHAVELDAKLSDAEAEIDRLTAENEALREMVAVLQKYVELIPCEPVHETPAIHDLARDRHTAELNKSMRDMFKD